MMTDNIAVYLIVASAVLAAGLVGLKAAMPHRAD